ncbi:MAG: M14 family metallopeptidase [Candidatus Aminicenantes bacterium]|nr:M14 family metallopeptidase [Candidatus Aminicenantes bacterium]
MRGVFKNGLLAIVVVFALSTVVPFLSAQKASDGYHDYAGLTKALQQTAAKNPKITELKSIGKTLKGKDLWMLQISGTNGLPAQDKQALLICANLEGDHVIGSEVALGMADYLVSGYGKDDEVTKILDSRTFYIVPRLNPDGAEHFFSNVLDEYSGNMKPRDDDYDWKMDEDGPEDLNGDGQITMMRVKDPNGDWEIDDADPRLMKRKSAEIRPDKLYSLYTEGRDNDGDGLYNEDRVGGFNINRNFPHNFGYEVKGLGVYPASEIETRALLDFITGYVPELKTQPRLNICGILLFSKYDNLAAGTGIECGTPTFPQPARQASAAPSGGMMMFRMGGRRGGSAEPELPPARDPQPKSTNAQDNFIFKTVSDQYKKITGIETALSEKPVGSLLEWGYFQFGVPSFSANLWSPAEAASRRPPMPDQRDAAPARAQAANQTTTPDRAAMMQRYMAGGGRPSSGASSSDTSDSDAKWLAWLDKEMKDQGFLPWTSFQHDQLGEVEIGGFTPYARVNPPAEKIKALTESHSKFALYLAQQFAAIELEAPTVEKLSSQLFKLTVKIRNTGEFPYVTAQGQRTGTINPIVLNLKFQDDKVMSLFGGSKRMDTPSLKPGEEKEFSWHIISPPGKTVDISIWARNGGGAKKKQAVLR